MRWNNDRVICEDLAFVLVALPDVALFLPYRASSLESCRFECSTFISQRGLSLLACNVKGDP